MIRGTRIRLRAIEPNDIDLMYHWENNVDIWPLSGTTQPFSKKTMIDFVENSHNDIYINKQLRLAIEKMNSDSQNGQTIGYIDLFDFDPTNRRAGVGILIADTDSRRQGFGLEAIELLCKYGADIIHLHQLFCNVHENNQASINLFKAAGFSKCGQLSDWSLQNGNWVNAIVMQRIF